MQRIININFKKKLLLIFKMNLQILLKNFIICIIFKKMKKLYNLTSFNAK
jgi:hypothetical protein